MMRLPDAQRWPGVDERRRHRKLRRQIEIRIVADDERILAAELEADLREHVAAR